MKRLPLVVLILGTTMALAPAAHAVLSTPISDSDVVVPHTISEELYQHATEPKRILVLEDGHHRSAQHDTEVQGETLRWLARVM